MKQKYKTSLDEHNKGYGVETIKVLAWLRLQKQKWLEQQSGRLETTAKKENQRQTITTRDNIKTAAKELPKKKNAVGYHTSADSSEHFFLYIRQCNIIVD